MRKVLAVAIAILLFTPVLFSQSIKPKTTMGFKAGLNISGFRSAVDYPDVENGPLAGFVAGVYVHIPLSSRFSLQPEFLYSQLGAKSKSIELWGGDYNFRYNYFAIPMLVKYSITPKFNVMAGAEGDILIRARQRGTPSTTITYNIKDFDFIYTVGIGTTNKQWSFDLRYLHGSQDVSYKPSESTFFNQAVQFTVGYQLKKKAKKDKNAK